MISTKEFEKLLAKKGKLQGDYTRLSNRREQLLKKVEDIEDELTAISYDIRVIREAMLK
jgi:chromosome segregation ATPase